MQCSFFILQQYMRKGFDALGTSTRARGNTSYNNSAAVPSGNCRGLSHGTSATVPSGNYRRALTRPRPLPASPPSPSANTSAQVATQRRKQRELHGGAQPAEGTGTTLQYPAHALAALVRNTFATQQRRPTCFSFRAFSMASIASESESLLSYLQQQFTCTNNNTPQSA